MYQHKKNVFDTKHRVPEIVFVQRGREGRRSTISEELSAGNVVDIE